MKTKNLYFLLIFVIFSSFNLLAQTVPCDNCFGEKDINTDPANASNCEKSSALNNFYWIGDPSYSQSPSYEKAWLSNGSRSQINNPFYTLSATGLLGQHSRGVYSDMHPEDGWELLKVNFGYLADYNTPRTELSDLMYMCLYNKYTGIMRFFGMLPNETSPWEMIRFKLEIMDFKEKSSSISPDLSATNFLSNQGDATQPLDQPTVERTMEIVAPFPAVVNRSLYFWFDVPVAYDPCLCKNDAAISLKYALQQTWDIEIKGAIDAKVIQKTEQVPNTNHSALVKKRIVGAVAATAIAIATKGTVVNTSAYTDLIDIYKNKPGLDPKKKSDLEKFQKIFSSAAGFVYDKKSNKYVGPNNEKLSKESYVKLFTQMNNFVSTAIDVGAPAQSKAKVSTSVIGTITATGTAGIVIYPQTQEYWGIPGSKWAKDLDEQVKEQQDGSENPEYPL